MSIGLCQQVEWSSVGLADFLIITKETSSRHCTVADAAAPGDSPEDDSELAF